MPVRTVKDSEHNQQGENLREYLKDSLQCVLNGRICPEKDNFTSVPWRGRSVVDYVIVPYSILHSMTDFSVKTVSDLVDEYSVHPPSRNVPDHSVLLCTLELSDYIVGNLFSSSGQTEQVFNGKQNNDVPRRKYYVSSVPINILDSERCCTALVNVINVLQNTTDCRKTVNEAYETLLTTMYAEMDVALNFKDVGPTAHKNRKHMGKPWWDDELQKLWNDVRASEKLYLKYNGCRRERSRLKALFISNRNNFDRRLQQSERRYRASQRDELPETQTNNPKVFWDEIRNLGPGRKAENIKGVYTEAGNISHDPDVILAKWKSDFQTLFNPNVNISDDSFLSKMDDLMRECEAEFQCCGNINNASYIHTESFKQLNDTIMHKLVRST